MGQIPEVPFVPDGDGIVSDPAFTKLIADRNYGLVGKFVTVNARTNMQYAKVCKYGQWGIIDTHGDEVIKLDYTFISDFVEGLAIATFDEYLPSRNDGYEDHGITTTRYVYINIKGQRVSRPYNYAKAFTRGLAVVNDGDEKAVINKSGQEIIPLQFTYINVGQNYIFASRQGKWGAFNLQGKPLIPFIYDKLVLHDGFLVGSKDNMYYLLNPDTGKPLTKEVYERINISSGIVYMYHQPFQPDVLPVSSGKLWFLVDKKGRRISDAYDTEITRASNHYYRVSKKSGMGLINDQGKEVIAFDYDYTGTYEDGAMFFAKKGEKVNYFNPEGKKIDVSAYDYVGNFRNGRASVYVKGKGFGMIDYSGKLVIPTIYERSSSGFENNANRAAMYKAGKCGIINRRGEVVIPFIYDGLHYGYKSYHTVLNQKKGLLDDHGKELIAPQYESLDDISFADGILKAQLNGKWGMIDLMNNVILPFEYDRIDLNKGQVVVRKGDFSGIVNLKGKVLLPVIYNISPSNNNFGKGLIPIDKEGKEYLADFYGHLDMRPDIKTY